MKKIFQKLLKKQTKTTNNIKIPISLKELQEKNKLYKFLTEENKKILKEVKKYNLNKEAIDEFNRLYKNFLKELNVLESKIIQDIEKNNSNIKDFEV